jgi:hypothetical protein
MTRVIVKDLKTGRESCMNEKSFEQSLKTRKFKDKNKKEVYRYELIKTLADDEEYALNTGEKVLPIEAEETEARAEAEEKESLEKEEVKNEASAQTSNESGTSSDPDEKKNESAPIGEKVSEPNNQPGLESNSSQETDDEKLARMIKEEEEKNSQSANEAGK